MPEEYFRAREQLLGTAEGLRRLASLPAETRERLRGMRRDGHRLFQEGRFAESLATFERHAHEVARLTGSSAARP